MNGEADAESFGDLLDRLLEGGQVEVHDPDLASLLEVARRLQEEAPRDEPDPTFRARLREELAGGTLDERRTGHPFFLSHLARGRFSGLRAAAALLLVAAAFWLAPWTKEDQDGDGPLARLPSLLGVASAYAAQMGDDPGPGVRGLIGDATFRLAAALPTAPTKARVYRQTPERLDEAGARELGRRLGIAVASAVDEPDYGVFVLAGKGGRLVVSKSFRGYFSFEAEFAPDSDPLAAPPPPPPVAPPGAAATPAPGEAEATEVAREFLRSRGLLDFDHVTEVPDEAPPGFTPLRRQVVFVPLVEGRPVRGLALAVTVGQGGGVVAVRSSLAALVPGDSYPILTAEEAYRQLMEKRMQAFQLSVRKSSGSGTAFASGASVVPRPVVASREAELPAYRVGEQVELEGLLSAIVFQAKDGQRRYQATLLAGEPDAPTRLQYRLSGEALERIVELDQQHVRIRGRVESISTRPPGGQLQVESFEKLYPAERIVTLLGRLDIEGERDEATLVLVGDGGKKYALESPTPAGRQREYRGKRAVVEGRTTDRASRDGYPVLELVGIRMGTDVDRMADLSGYRSQRPQVVPEREPLIAGEVQVKGAALEYYATAAAGLPPRFAPPDLEPFLLVQPVYTFSGSFDEGRGSFEALVQAVRPEYVREMR